MQEPPSVQALEGAHEFPGPYTFKIFGPGEQAFVDAVRAVAEEHGDDDRGEPDMSGRLSKRGNYICVTLDMRVESAEHVRDVYRALHEIDGIRMLI